MTIDIDPETEAIARKMAYRAGLPIEIYVRTAILHQIQADSYENSRVTLSEALQSAMQDPLFLADLHDTEHAFKHSDAETGSLIADE